MADSVHLAPLAVRPALTNLYRDLGDYFNIPSPLIAVAAEKARSDLARLWREHGSFDDELAWYKRPDVGMAYLFDLVDWNAQMAGELAEALAEVQNVRVLDWGAGVGTMALLLASQGCAVDIYEPNEELKEFMRFRALQQGLDVREVDEPDGEYEVIICWHVLEHTKDYEAVVSKLTAALAPDGRVFTDSDFHVDADHPMHHNSVEPQVLWLAAGLVGGETPWWRKPKQ